MIERQHISSTCPAARTRTAVTTTAVSPVGPVSPAGAWRRRVCRVSGRVRPQ